MAATIRLIVPSGFCHHTENFYLPLHIMSEFINLILYGFYQIDYVFGVRPYPYYHISTGGLVFSLSILIYTYSAVLFIVGGGVQCGFFNSLSSSEMKILFIIVCFFVTVWWYYWLDRERYKTSFEKLDKEPSFVRWGCFILAVFWGIGGILFLHRCIIYLHKVGAIVQ